MLLILLRVSLLLDRLSVSSGSLTVVTLTVVVVFVVEFSSSLSWPLRLAAGDREARPLFILLLTSSMFLLVCSVGGSRSTELWFDGDGLGHEMLEAREATLGWSATALKAEDRPPVARMEPKAAVRLDSVWGSVTTAPAFDEADETGVETGEVLPA